MARNTKFPHEPTHDIIMNAQETMMSNMTARAKGKVFNYWEPTQLPITEGSARWMEFKATLVSYMVEDEDYWENVRITGSALSNAGSKVFVAPGSDNADEEMKPEYVGLDLLHLQRLDIMAHEAEIFCRTFDDSSDFTNAVLKEFKKTASVGLAGATATIPYGGGSLESIGLQAIDDIIKFVGSPNEIGSLGYALSERPSRNWNREPDQHSWVGHKFLYNYNVGSDGEWDEGYMLLFRFELKSRELVTGQIIEEPEEKPRKKEIEGK